MYAAEFSWRTAAIAAAVIIFVCLFLLYYYYYCLFCAPSVPPARSVHAIILYCIFAAWHNSLLSNALRICHANS